MSTYVRKICLGLFTVFLFVFIAMSSNFSVKAYASKGIVIDSSQRRIVGIWVEVDGGNSGWASWKYNPKNSRYNSLL